MTMKLQDINQAVAEYTTKHGDLLAEFVKHADTLPDTVVNCVDRFPDLSKLPSLRMRISDISGHTINAKFAVCWNRKERRFEADNISWPGFNFSESGDLV